MFAMDHMKFTSAETSIGESSHIASITFLSAMLFSSVSEVYAPLRISIIKTLVSQKTDLFVTHHHIVMLILVHHLKNKLEYRAVSLAVNALVINEHFITDAGRTAHIVEQR